MASGPNPPRKVCHRCGMDVASRPRVRDDSGHYFCQPCWGDLHKTPAASGPDVTSYPAFDLAPDASSGNAPPVFEEDGYQQVEHCAQCGRIVTGSEIWLQDGRPMCRACSQAGSALPVKWIAVGAGVVVLVGVLLWFLTSRPVPAAPVAEATPAAVTQPVRPRAVPVVAAPVKVETAEALDARLAALFDRARQAKADGKYAELLRIQQERRALIKAAPPGVSPLIDAWAQDAAVEAEAQQRVNATRYVDAVKLLLDRTVQRHYPTGRPGPMFNGELVVARVKASLAAAVLLDHWVLPASEMADWLQTAFDNDPTCVEAMVIKAWLAGPELGTHEELLRLDVRESILKRNQQLLPIQSSVLASQTSADLTGGVPAEVSRRILAPLDFTIGTSRLPVNEEAQDWLKRLDNPRLSMRDRNGTRLLLKDGVLWRRLRGRGGLYEWQLLSQPPEGSAQLVANQVTLVRYDALPPDPGQQEVARILDARQPTESYSPINKHTVKLYTPGQASPDELWPLLQCFTDTKQLHAAWVRSNLLPTADARGTCLAMGVAEARTFPAIASWATDVDGKLVKYPLRNLFAFLEPLSSDKTPVVFFKKPDGRQYLLTDDQQEINVDPEGGLFVSTAGGSRIDVPYYGANFDRPSMRETVRRVVQAVTKNPGLMRNNLAERIQALRGMVEADADKGPQADPLIKAIAARTNVRDIVKAPGRSARQAGRGGPRSAAGDLASDNTDLQAGYLFRQTIAAIRSDFARMPFGYDTGKRLVLRSGGELVFIDKNGDQVYPFYSNDELAKLRSDFINDFVLPSENLIPTPLSIPFRTDTNPSMQPFMLERANQAWHDGDLHLAATLYRDLKLPSFSFKLTDDGPESKAESDAVVSQITVRAVEGEKKLRARLSQAAVLRQAGHDDYADAVLRAVVAEWVGAGLPVLSNLQRRSEVHGYAPEPAFAEAVGRIRKDVEEARGATTRLPPPAAPTAAGVKFDPAAIGENVESGLEQFYDARPAFREYLRAKQWVAKQDVRLTRREPRNNDLERQSFLWAPVAVEHDQLTRLTSENVFAAATPDGDDIRSRWARVLYALETRPESGHDVLPIREMLVNFATAERAAAEQLAPAAPEAIAHTLNAAGLMCLAVSTDRVLESGFGPARFDPSVTESLALEVEHFVKPRMLAMGLSRTEIMDLADPVIGLTEGLSAEPDRYSMIRYAWTEYGPLVDPLKAYVVKGG